MTCFMWSKITHKPHINRDNELKERERVGHLQFAEGGVQGGHSLFESPDVMIGGVE